MGADPEGKAEIISLSKVAGLSLIDRIMTSDIWRDLGIQLLLLGVERSQLVGLGIRLRCFLGTFHLRFYGHIDHRVEPDHSEET